MIHTVLGVLAPTECQITEILNGKYELSITHPIDNDGKWRYIKESNIIKALWQLFTIKTVSYSYGAIKNEVTAKAEHIFYQQADWWILPNPDTEKIFFIPGSSVSTFLDTIDDLATKIIITGQIYYLYNWDSDITIPQDMPLRELPNSDGISPVGAIMDSGGLLDNITGELYRDNFHFSIRTPLSNSITELHTMMRYLEYYFLRDHGLQHFDNWISVVTHPKGQSFYD